MVVAKLTYEEQRNLRLEENKKKMEELHLPLLAQALKNFSPKPRPTYRSSSPRIARKEVVELRRSGRIAKHPAPEYREIVTSERERFNSTRKGKYLFDHRVYASDKDRENATLKAEELEVSLGADHPTFVKPMLQSHTTGCFSLGFPLYFTRMHLPIGNETVTLIDEEGEEYPTRLSRNAAVTSGWRRFSIKHGLVDGDALVFQLVRPTALQVYIIRVNGSSEEMEGGKTESLDALMSGAYRANAGEE